MLLLLFLTSHSVFVFESISQNTIHPHSKQQTLINQSINSQFVFVIRQKRFSFGSFEILSFSRRNRNKSQKQYHTDNKKQKQTHQQDLKGAQRCFRGYIRSSDSQISLWSRLDRLRSFRLILQIASESIRNSTILQ